MFRRLALQLIKITLMLFAPKTSDTVQAIVCIAKLSQPFVKEAAGMANVSCTTRNEYAVDKMIEFVAKHPCIHGIENTSIDLDIIESGVQLAYSLYKANMREEII